MQDAFAFVVSTLVDLYVITFFLRLVLQWVRADFRNPLAQFIVRVTNPVVLPLRRVIPAIGGLDTATILGMLAVQSLATAILVPLACLGGAEPGQVLSLALLRLAHLILRTYSLLMLVYVVMSWIGSGTYNPAARILADIVEPVLAPFRRLIPTIGGLDISPVFAFIAIEFLNRALPSGAAFAGLMCPGF
jgi:YggT family protein